MFGYNLLYFITIDNYSVDNYHLRKKQGNSYLITV